MKRLEVRSETWLRDDLISILNALHTVADAPGVDKTYRAGYLAAIDAMRLAVGEAPQPRWDVEAEWTVGEPGRIGGRR